MHRTQLLNENARRNEFGTQSKLTLSIMLIILKVEFLFLFIFFRNIYHLYIFLGPISLISNVYLFVFLTQELKSSVQIE